MFLYKKRDILAGIITLLMLLGSTSSAAASTQTDISQTDVTFTPDTPLPSSGLYEAEDAERSPAFTIATNASGYTGTGFVDYRGEGYVKWTVDVAADGNYDLGFRYALSSGNRPLSISVDSSSGGSTIDFPATGSWDTWGEVRTTVSLTVGTHTIYASSTGLSGANVDNLSIAASDRILPLVTEPIPELTPEPQISACKSGPAQQLGQIKDSISGAGLVDATVKIDGCSTKTDANGFYTLNNIVVNDEAVINFEKEGYLLGSTKIQITETFGDGTTSTNYLEYNMLAYSEAWTNGRLWIYDSQNGATGGAVEIPTGTIHTDAAGNVYNGTVSACWVFKDIMTTEGRDAFPGNFKGINTNGVLVPFVSFGLTSLELEDVSGASLSVSEHITLVLPLLTGTTENILPLWYYDYDQGLWIEEGYAERRQDGTYHADISHPGTWSLSQPIEEEVGIYRGHIINENGSPVSDVRVYAVGENWISSDLSADENGLFEIEVIPGINFKLKAYDYNNKYGANYNGIIAAVASGETIED